MVEPVSLQMESPNAMSPGRIGTIDRLTPKLPGPCRRTVPVRPAPDAADSIGPITLIVVGIDWLLEIAGRRASEHARALVGNDKRVQSVATR